MSGIRHDYRQLEDYEKNLVKDIKGMAQTLWDTIDSIPTSRDGAGRSVSIAKRKVEEAVMWATHAATTPESDKEHN